MRFSGLLLLMVIGLGTSGTVFGESRGDDQTMVQVEEVQVILTVDGPVVLLLAEKQAIPIFVDPTVAVSIEGALTDKKFHRPLSHDLMSTILQSFGGEISRVTVRLKDRVYRGELQVSMNGQTKFFDSRSSDAIALAIHFKAPILVGKDLLEQAGQDIGESPKPKLEL